jgi:hypothetical protein
VGGAGRDHGDGLGRQIQFFGRDHRLTGQPAAYGLERLPSTRLQYEFAYAAYRRDEQEGPQDDDETRANAAYIAAASPDVLLALLDRLEAAERERDEARGGLAEAHWALNSLRVVGTDQQALDHVIRRWRERWQSPDVFARAMVDATLAAKEQAR